MSTIRGKDAGYVRRQGLRSSPASGDVHDHLAGGKPVWACVVGAFKAATYRGTLNRLSYSLSNRASLWC